VSVCLLVLSIYDVFQNIDIQYIYIEYLYHPRHDNGVNGPMVKPQG